MLRWAFRQGIQRLSPSFLLQRDILQPMRRQRILCDDPGFNLVTLTRVDRMRTGTAQLSIPWKMGQWYGGAMFDRHCHFATNRQRIKTPSCLKRRFKMTGKGEFVRFGAGHSHNLSKKSKRARKYGKKKHLVPKSFAKILKRLNFKRR